MRIRFFETASQDLKDGAAFYESQGEGLGTYFVSSLIADIDSLKVYAGIQAKEHGYFKLISRRFPFAVYYKIDEDVILIRRVLSTKMDPDRIRKML